MGTGGQSWGTGSVPGSGLAPSPGLSPTPHPGTVPLSPAPSPCPRAGGGHGPSWMGHGEGAPGWSQGGSSAPSARPSTPSARWLWTGGVLGRWCPGQQPQGTERTRVSLVLVVHGDIRMNWCPVLPVQSSQGPLVPPVLGVHGDKLVLHSPSTEWPRTPSSSRSGAILGQTGARCSQYRTPKDSH